MQRIYFFNVTENLKRTNSAQSEKESSNGYFIPGILPTMPTQNRSSANPNQKNVKSEIEAYSIEKVEINIAITVKIKVKYFEDIALLLYEQALIQEGIKLENPAEFVKRLNLVIANTL